jgi:hypothetical protein
MDQEGTAVAVPFVSRAHNSDMNRWLLAPLLMLLAAGARADSVVYRCPGPPVLYTDALSVQEAKEKGCRTIESAPVTVIQGRTRPLPTASAAGGKTADGRIDPATQRARDSDARRILEDELRREQGGLADLQREYNNGEPERRGDERNFQRYLDRVAELKAGIARKEADIAAIRRELTKLAP